MPARETNTCNFEKHIKVVTPDKTAITHLSEHTTLSTQRLKKAMTNGAVWLESSIGTHRIRRAKKILSENDTLHLYYDEAIQNSRPECAELIADESEYSIWNKPYGMYSQGTKWGDHHTIYRWAEQHLKPQRPAFLVHRLDRAANGLIILAHTKKVATAFSEMFKNHQIVKHYSAIVEGEAEFTLPHTITTGIDNKPALSIIHALNKVAVNNNAMHNNIRTMVTIEIKTGRKHQIRKHLAESGYPIVGDRLYGSAMSEENLQLQSNYLKFNCPIRNSEQEYTLDE